MNNNDMIIPVRQAWVDIAKGIAIIAVVFGHIRFAWPDTKLLPLSDMLIWLWHVPVFFMIGGFFLKDEKLLCPGRFIWGKIKTLYLPLIYIYIVVLMLHNVFISIGFYDVNVEYVGKFVTLWGIPDFIKHLAAALACAGREPLLGAMWFGFVLFLALCIISVTSWLINQLGKKWSDKKFETVRGLVFLLFAILSCSLTKLLNFTIPRFNNTLVAVWLIYVGMIMVRKIKVQFNNGLVALSCAAIAWHVSSCWGGGKFGC